MTFTQMSEELIAQGTEIKKKSTHKVEVVPITLEPHPNAEFLSIVHVFGYIVCVKTEDWKDKTIGAYIVPDSVVDTTRPEFSFLGEHSRIRVKRMRGVPSQGFLVPAPEGSKIGDDVSEFLGVTRYEPPEPFKPGGEATKSPTGLRPIYDIDSWHRYKHLFVPGEQVVATEKINGANGRWCFVDGQMHCGSRTEWKKYDKGNLWWRALECNPEVEDYCKANPGETVYGEVYGQVGKFAYAMNSGRGVRGIAVFDLLMKDGITWYDYDIAKRVQSLPWVPEVYRGPYNEEILLALAEKDTIMPYATHMSEGLVVKPIQERSSLELSRVIMKIVSNRYHLGGK